MNAENIHFYLKDPEAKGETLVYLFFRYRGKLLKYSTGKKVRPEDWNPATQLLKATRTGASERKGAAELNGFFKSLKEELVRVFNLLSREGVPSPEELRNELNRFARREKAPTGASFFAVWEEFLKVKQTHQTQSTYRNYASLLTVLRGFERQYHFRLTFEKIDSRFFDLLSAYFAERKLLNNTVSTHIKLFKAFMRWALERGYHANLAFSKFRVPKSETDVIYLTWEELMRLYALDLAEIPRLERVRDVFCLGCFTGSVILTSRR